MCIDKEKKTPTTNIFELIIVFSGYISPEYALEGLFSIKSDVFWRFVFRDCEWQEEHWFISNRLSPSSWICEYRICTFSSKN